MFHRQSRPPRPRQIVFSIRFGVDFYSVRRNDRPLIRHGDDHSPDLSRVSDFKREIELLRNEQSPTFELFNIFSKRDKSFRSFFFPSNEREKEREEGRKGENNSEKEFSQNCAKTFVSPRIPSVEARDFEGNCDETRRIYTPRFSSLLLQYLGPTRGNQ